MPKGSSRVCAAPEVFTVDELARAALVDARAVRARIAAGALTLIPGTRYIAAAGAVRAGRELRAGVLAALPLAPAELFERTAHPPAFADGRDGARIAASACVYILLASLLLFTPAAPQRTVEAAPRDEARLVFLMTPGPGGGGGGGGLRNPKPAPKIRRLGVERPRAAVPEVTPDPVLTTTRREEPKMPTPAPPAAPTPVEKAPEPVAATVIVAPVVQTAANTVERAGVIDDGRDGAPSQGSGIGGGAGSGQGTGNGEGLGAGIGDGSGGGTGGGPFRPGAGIDPPRLLREVKADYTDDARRRGIQGEVLLEIVIRSDGSVGDVTLLDGLGAGLDQRAVAAVRQWRFAPARRKGVSVDILVEVAVEFTLR